MDDVRMGRRERRRRKVQKTVEASKPACEFQKTIENVEFSIKPHVTQSLGILTRRDTYTVLPSKTDMDLGNGDDPNNESSRNDSTESKNCTYSLDKNPEASDGDTYNIEKSPGNSFKRNESCYVSPENGFPPVLGENEIRPVPAPRKFKSISLDIEKVSTDTDGDVAEIDLDDFRSDLKLKQITNSSESESGRSELIMAPIPKPRRAVRQFQKAENERVRSSDESLHSKSDDLEEKSVKSEAGEDPKPEGRSNELLLIGKLQSESTDFKPETEEFKTEFEIDSPHYTEFSKNGQIYVQSKTGFRIMERNEILRNGNQKKENEENGRMPGSSSVKTAILFHKYCSRFMIFIHGILAGLGFSHVAAVTSIIHYYNFEPQTFIGIYSRMSLNIHYAFYVLTALCIISCLDRVDIGHMNRRHWRNALKFPALWVILLFYMVSFVLTLSNQQTEARFDAHSPSNITEIWDTESYSAIQRGLVQWYHKVWARDLLVVLAWLLIALSNFPDFLHSHISNMAEYSETRDVEKNLHHAPGPKVHKWSQLNCAYGDCNETWMNLKGDCAKMEDWITTAEEVLETPSKHRHVDLEKQAEMKHRTISSKILDHIRPCDHIPHIPPY